MNNTLQVFRRLLTFRSCNLIFSSSHCDGRNVNNKSDGNESTSPDGSSAAQSHSQSKESGSYKDPSSSTTREAESSSIKSAQELTSKEITHNVEESDAGRLKINSTISIKGDSITSENVTNEAVHSELKERNGDGTDSISKSGEDRFLDAFKKQEKLVSEQLREKSDNTKHKSTETFASLLRNSPFIDMGDPVGKTVLGEIYLIVEENLYIDFGWKFHTVCPIPRKNSQFYVPGAKVFLRINDLELSAKFLGEKSHISLLEADCDVLGLAFSKDRLQKAEEK